MVPVTEPPRSAQVALLELEKGSNAPASQLNEAAQIIGIDLRVHEAKIYEGGESAELQPATAAAPKEEWVLRWLLKKLKAANGPLNYKLDSDSWLLLRLLLDRIPPKTIAAILNEHKFLGILENGLVDLDKFSGESGSEDRLAEDSTSKVQKRGHKRKRMEVEAESSDSTITQEFTPSSWASTLLSVLVSIQRLAVLSNQSHGVDGTSQSHLKLALRAEPRVAANILGKSFKIATSALQVLADAPESNTPRKLLAVLPSVFDIWDLRSGSQNDSTKNQSDATFCSSFFPQALQLLATLQKLPLTFSEKDDVVRPMEQTVALHVVIPARAEFFSKHASGITSIDQKPDSDLIKAVASNFRSCFGDKNSVSNDHVPKLLAASGGLLPTLLDIAIRSVPRDTFKRQNNEAPWLEALFIALAELAGCPLEAEIPQDDTTSSRKALEDLFRVVVERKISISLKTLSTFTSRFSGLLDSEADQVAWNLISKLISVGVDVFLPNSGLKDSKPLLDDLLGHIGKLSVDPSSTEVSSQKETYDTIKSGIIIPLLHGFASARDINTFAELWFEQLVATRSSQNRLFSVWEDDDVAAAYSNSASKSLSDNQIISQAQTIFKELGNVDMSAETFARVVILDSIAISEMRVDGTTEIKETYQSILKAITSAIASKERPQWQWRLWRLARNILDKHLRWVDASFTDLGETLIGETAKFSRKKLKSGLATNEYLEALEVFRFTMFALEMTNDDRYASQIECVFTQAVSLMRRVRDLDNPPSASSPDGRFQTINSPQNLAIGYLMVLLSKPETVVRLTSDQRRALFEEMFFLGAMAPTKQRIQLSEGRGSTDSSEITFRRIWDGFISYRWLLDAQPAAYDILEILSARIKQDADSAPFIISSMVNVPARLIPRHQRGKILDLLQEVLLNGQDLGSEMYIEIFAFMTSLVNQPKSSAQIANDPEILWKIAGSFNLPGTDADQLIRQSFRNLHQAVLDGFLVASEEQRHKYFQLSFSKSRGIVDKLDTIDYTSMAFFTARISLLAQSLHRKEAQASPKEDVDAVRQRVFELILEDLKSSRKLLKKGDGKILETKLRGVLEALEDFEDIAQGNKDVHRNLKKTEEEIVEAKGFDSDTSLQRLVKRRVLSTQKPGKNIVRPLIQGSNIFPIQQLNREEQRVFFGETRQRLSSMSTEGIVEFIHDIQNHGFSVEDAPYRLLLAGMAVTCFKAIEDRDSPESGELTSLFTAVTECLHGSLSIEQFSLATECLDVLLRTQSRSITQWNIDNVLGAILTSTTRSGPQIPSDQGGIIYGRLCRLMGTLINLYRRKLGGRFHLILPVTQGLLRCLFTTSAKQRKSTRTQSDQPPWLASSKSGLTTEHAVQYTRVITSLCDPTMSAVHTQRGPGGNDLTDPTKKAKRVAGQHLQYLVMEYAQCQLQNSLTPEMKAALMPGLYAVLDVMSKDTMRTMNAAMDSSSRAVFKGLYDDYNRFGKWNKN